MSRQSLHRDYGESNPLFERPNIIEAFDACLELEQADLRSLVDANRAADTPRTYRDRVAAYFKDRPIAWIGGMELANIGGAYAWRTRVSDCRRDLGMTIENRVRTREDGVKVSEYRYVP